MLCPECKDPMMIVECDHVELDACVVGHGLWFDADELRQLFELAGVPEALHELEEELRDLPDMGRGARRRCPRCGGRMLQVAASGSADTVVLDRCSRGHGLWFDDGELADVLSAGVSQDEGAMNTLKKHLGAFVAPRVREEPEEKET